MTSITRRDFLSRAARMSAGAAFLPAAGFLSTGLAGQAWGASEVTVSGPQCDLAVARGGDPARNCLAALEAVGGLGRFVKAGQRVVIKPNPVGSYPPERAINTHPEVVRAVVKECARLGAKQILIISHDGARDFHGNGLAKAIEEAGGSWKCLQKKDEFREVIVPRGRNLSTVELATDLLAADVFINMPLVKHHAGSEITFSLKNLMGLNWDRQALHNTGLQRGIAELASSIKHDLIVLDANYCLLTNGPVGPGRVQNVKQVIVGTDPVAVDAYATRFLRKKPEEIEHIRLAYELGVGEMNLDRLRIREFDV